MEYNLKRTCANCKNVDLFPVSKMEATFELYNSSEIWKTKCTKCGSEKAYSLQHATPKLDKEILDIWGNDPKLFLMIQDEEVFLAEYDYFPMLLEAIDESRYLKSKIDVLVESICVLLYDYTVAPEEYSEKENKERESIAEKIRPELIKRKNRIVNAGDTIMDYIKEVVYPQIGIKTKENNKS